MFLYSRHLHITMANLKRNKYRIGMPENYSFSVVGENGLAFGYMLICIIYYKCLLLYLLLFLYVKDIINLKCTMHNIVTILFQTNMRLKSTYFLVSCLDFTIFQQCQVLLVIFLVVVWIYFVFFLWYSYRNWFRPSTTSWLKN